MKKLAAMALLDTTVLSQNLRGFLGDHYGSFSASLDWQKSAGSVEKVGLPKLPEH
jgi:hypothetical protein